MATVIGADVIPEEFFEEGGSIFAGNVFPETAGSFFLKKVEKDLQQAEDIYLQKVEDKTNQILEGVSSFSEKDRKAVLGLIP